MHKKIVFTFLVLQCTLCLTIRVPVDWNDDSEVKDGQFVVTKDKSQTPQPPIYNEYFQYTAHKPQFAIDVAAAHGAQSPEKHFESHPVRPHTGLTKPVLGQHQILNPDMNKYESYQPFLQNAGYSNYVTPASTSFEVYHPYKDEQQALKEIYKDPVLDKIRNDLRDSKNRLQKYENEAGEVDKDEYLETPEQTDRKKQPQKNIPAQFEIHRPQRRPVYYRMPFRPNYREQVLNHKLRHPWNQNIAKVTPNHYRPVKNHLSRLRQQHAMKYDDEHNEYPQLPAPEGYNERPDGYDIYEKNKGKYVQLRNNFDETMNKVVQQNRPYTNNKIELQSGYANDDLNNGQDEELFVPIKNYAQVRKTETTKHLPRKAALQDAQNIEEIQNAPRLREAIKSTKAQIVYSEEGYEDAAYDHAGEQKHASDHERHGGYLKENEISGGKYKTPSVSDKYEDSRGLVHRDQILHGEKWKDSKKETEDEKESNDYSEDENEEDLSTVIIDNLNIDNDSDRNKRNSDDFETESAAERLLENEKKEIPDNSSANNSQHEVIKRETSFKIPEFDFNSTLPSDDEILKLSKTNVTLQKLKTEDLTKNNKKIKYPYYSKNIKILNKNSPLRYAENIDFIPKKSKGGTEFYDSRSKHECSEVEDNVEVIPEKLNKDGDPDDDENSDGETNEKKIDNNLKKKQRLKGLGDKIDCFKVKYFGENPLDSPFFNEEIIENPEPITKPNLKVFETKKLNDKSNNKLINYDTDIFTILEKVQNKNNKFTNPLKNDLSIKRNSTLTNNTLLLHQSNPLLEVLNDTNNALQKNVKLLENIQDSNLLNRPIDLSNVTYKHFQNKEDVTQPPLSIRKKRATPFLYEPYKIIRDSQVQDSKKTTTSSNISPLIKQLQSSRVIDKVTTNIDKDQGKKNSKIYKDIGKVDRQKFPNEQIVDTKNSSFVDISSGKRRGEPRYELRPTNHKTTYSPVENKRAISAEDYKSQISNDATETNTKQVHSTTPKRSISSKMTSRPYFDVSKYLPEVIETQNIAASNTIRKVIRTTTPEVTTDKQKYNDEHDENEEYDEYEDEDDDEDNEEEINITTTTTTTTTTRKPTTRKRTRGTTTIKPIQIEKETEPPKLRLTTRFRNSPSMMKSSSHHHEEDKDPIQKVSKAENDSANYTEKKRKSTKSTLVTDTKSYGEDDDDMTRKEVDALLRVKQDMEEYMPRYEKENTNENKKDRNHSDDSADEVSDKNENEEDEEEDEDDEDDDDDDDDEFDDEEEEDNDQDDKDDSKHKNKKSKLEITTSEPTKRTLIRTTVAPATTTESRSARIELKPTVLKKKYEMHQELPINRSSPHITQFKQDIKEIEIIKEMKPKLKKKNHKNLEALDLFRDEKLAEEINKLGDVEVFRENLNLKSGPKHGGNYRSLTSEDIQKEIGANKVRNSAKMDDVETSPTQPRKRIKLNEERTSRRNQNFASRGQSSSNDNAKNIKLTDVDVIDTRLNTGSLKSKSKDTRQNNKSAKLIELDVDDEDDTSRMHGGNYKSYENRNTGRQMHGGNYKSAKIIQPEDSNKSKSRSNIRDARTNAASLLNDYARAVPILTTAPPFILDPSKRMYYYVDS
ncbi:intracellular protein transport protein USO1-like [Vanessa cardui]|uniref:intracellular protein transport protein USO1-like n=1 Tax=Vanessa cardui TaxID=171605 RepID=UPI001F1378B2|nr:intracellular protein transport protein USO1-like [Vanessa cardui]